MKPILVLYATREGHTRTIADHISKHLRERGFDVEIHDAQGLAEPFALGDFAAAVLAASVHGAQHEPEMVHFVKRHRGELEAMPSAFLSVSLTEAGAEDEAAPAARRTEAAHDVERMIHNFFYTTGWHPQRVHPVAGALLYTQYGLLLRLVMKFVAHRAGGSTDTSQDHVYTDWKGLDGYMDELLSTLPRAS